MVKHTKKLKKIQYIENTIIILNHNHLNNHEEKIFQKYLQ